MVSGTFFVMESEPDVRTIHAHVVEYKSAYWGEYVCFRDLLRQDPHIRQAYSDMKQRSAEAFTTDRRAYTAAKHEYVQSVLRDHTNVYGDRE